MRRLVLGAVLALAAQGARAEIVRGADDPGCRAAVALSDPQRGAEILVLKDGRRSAARWKPRVGAPNMSAV